MVKKTIRQQKRRVKGQPGRPRLSVFRSNRMIYAQVIDDQKKKTLVAASDNDLSAKNIKAASGQTKTDKARLVGELLAKKALKAKITQVVFDRGKRPYHGRIKALAEGARNSGLKF